MKIHKIHLGYAWCQFLYLSATAVSLSFSGIVGAFLASDKAQATLPFAISTVATALATLVVPRILEAKGRRFGFILGSSAGLLGALVCCTGILHGMFSVFCAGGIGLGIYQAFAQHYRYAAAESADLRDKGRAVSYVLLGGILASVAGPTIANASKDLLSNSTFAGSYLAAALLCALSIPILTRLNSKYPGQAVASAPNTSAPSTWSTHSKHVYLGMVFCASGYAMMIYAMTATPLAYIGCGYPTTGAANVIQWHLLAMFAPSLFTGRLVDKFGGAWVATAGVLLEMAGALMATSGTTEPQFLASLILNGIGWNLMYVGGTSMLTTISSGSRVRIQGTNEILTFTSVAVLSALSGWIYHEYGWSALNTSIWVLLAPVAAAGLFISKLPTANRT